MIQLYYLNIGPKHHSTRLFGKNVTRTITMISKSRKKRTIQVGSSSTIKPKKVISRSKNNATFQSEQIRVTNTNNTIDRSQGIYDVDYLPQKKSTETNFLNQADTRISESLLKPHDPSISPISTSVLDQLFQDSSKNLSLEADLYTAGIKLKDWVTPETPIATTYAEVRGVLSALIKYCFSLQFLRMAPIHTCEFFKGYYFPPWHIIAIGRKSRPSFVSIFGKGEEFNGNKEMAASQLLIRRSRNPIAYAVGRNFITKYSRGAFYDTFMENPNSVDGVYLIRSMKYPYPNPIVGKSEFSDRQLTALEREMEVYVKKAAVMASKPMPWVEKVTQRVNWPFLQHLIKKQVPKPNADKRWLFWRDQ